MVRESKATRDARISVLLGQYDAKIRELRKLEAEVKSLKAEVDEVEVGTYGDWVRGAGTPREILDQQEAKRLLKDAGMTIPKKMTEAPIVVTPKP